MSTQLGFQWSVTPSRVRRLAARRKAAFALRKRTTHPPLERRLDRSKERTTQIKGPIKNHRSALESPEETVLKIMVKMWNGVFIKLMRGFFFFFCVTINW